jgi:hypothetical protein
MTTKKQTPKTIQKGPKAQPKSHSTPSCCAEKAKCCAMEIAPKTKELKSKTKIIARFDCGFPNSLFIRGEGISTLSWDKGAVMKNVSPNEWMWESDRPCSTMQFKVLINDNCFEQGENHTIAFGQAVEFTPKF